MRDKPAREENKDSGDIDGSHNIIRRPNNTNSIARYVQFCPADPNIQDAIDNLF